MKEVNIYLQTTINGPRRQDGAAGYVLETPTDRGPVTLTGMEILSGATEQEAALTVAVGALERMRTGCNLTIYTDSRFLAGAVNQGWMQTWQENGWKTVRGRPLAYQYLWEKLAFLLEKHAVTIQMGTNHPYKRWLSTELVKAKNAANTDKYKEGAQF